MNRVTRTAYCEKCAKSDRPAFNNQFVLYGSTGQIITVYQVERHVPRKLKGYTPHIFTVTDRKNEKLVVEKVCTMNNCGIKLYDDGKDITYTIEYRSIIEMELKKWNHLVKFKDETYHI